jgi:hypothetical protein
MATCAHRRDSQATFHESFAVNALLVSFYDLMLRTEIPNSSLFSLTVAAGTKIRHIRSECHRLDIGFSFNGMRPMALLTCWRVWIILRNKSTMSTLRELLSDFRVAR